MVHCSALRILAEMRRGTNGGVRRDSSTPDSETKKEMRKKEFFNAQRPLADALSDEQGVNH
jgi:hypothetical protein